MHGQEVDRLWVARVPDVDAGQAGREVVAHVGEALGRHDLTAIGPAALIGMAEVFYVAGTFGNKRFTHGISSGVSLFRPASIQPTGG